MLLHSGYTVLVCRPDGGVSGEGREGLYDYDTRILSRWRLTVDGAEPERVSSGALANDRWLACLRHPLGGGSPAGPRLPQDALEVAVARRIGPGMAERLTVRNHSMAATAVEVALELDADFADVQEVIGERQQEGETKVEWDDAERALTFEYRAERDRRVFQRGLRVRVARADGEPERRGRRLALRLDLPPRGSWTADLAYESLVDGAWRSPGPLEPEESEPRQRRLRRARDRRVRLATAHAAVELAFDRAAEDLIALRNLDLEPLAPGEDDAWVPNAGVPTYTGLFGRDLLTAAWQGALLGPEMLRGALSILAATQAREDSAWRDAQPGRMLHEMRRGPLSELELIPQRAYYGTQTTSSVYAVALSELWHWMGDDEALRRFKEPALAALDWAARFGDADGDGFLESVKRSPKGLKNQGWKDSDEAIRYPDGTLVENPLSTVEEQAFHLLGLQRMAEVLVALGEDGAAEELLGRERELRRRWHEAYWMPEAGFYAMALDRDKRQVAAIGSNPGHALAAGVVPPEQAQLVADRLLAPDLFSGWGVRTLSADHPSYNPFAYHLGSVWPVESGTFALACKRYGLDEHLERLAEGLFAAAARCRDARLPEALGGHGRDDSPVPTLYPGANCPQAWSASAVLLVVQALLGIYPFAPARVLALVRPRLPEWLPEVTISQLRVGEAEVALRFIRRADGGAEHEVVERRGELRIVVAPPPQDLAPEREPWSERLVRWGLEHAPGRLARALRIALGDDEPQA